MKNLFKVLLISQSVLVFVYTILAFKNDGTDLLSIFLSNIQSLNWNGQFNIDFSCYLVLSGLWIAWRNKFTTFSILFGVFASILGIMALAPYLLYLMMKENGNLKRVMIGER